MKKLKLHKLFIWEYWPAAFFYIPNIPYASYLAIRARHPAFFSAANPCIKSSGNGTESKFETLQLIPEEHRPKSVFHTEHTSFKETLKDLKNKNIYFPLIAKPDIGFRGLLVQKVHTEKELASYLKKYPIDIIIQEFLEYKNECGIFYHRIPTQKKGKISSITLKKFLSVSGDGKTTLENLILNDTRARLYFQILLEIHQEKLQNIPGEREIVQLSVIGNHSKGTQFISGNHLITKKLEDTLDTLSASIPGWYYGRIDLKYNSFCELEKGNHFKILEINGIISEPTHIYDAETYTYFQALKAIRTHWKCLFNVATTNHKEFKIPYKSAKCFLSEMFQLRTYTKKINELSKN